MSFSDKVQALRYLQQSKHLVSCSADGAISVWNMELPREEVNTHTYTFSFYRILYIYIHTTI